MSALSWFKGRRGASGFGYASTAAEVTEGLDLHDKTVVITGVSSGLGKESARVLSSRGARIVGLARTMAKADEVCDRLPTKSVGVACELTDPSSIRAAADALRELGGTIDVLMCNAGIMALPARETLFDIEKQFFTNHIGHFLLVTELLDQLSHSGRVVILSSGAHAWAPPEGIRFEDLSFASGYTPNRAYGHSKLANLLFARALSRRLAEGQTANAVHPGVIATNLSRHMNPVVRAVIPIASALAMKSVEQGAATQCYVAAHPDVAAVTGTYFADCNVARCTRAARDDTMAERLWEISEQIVRRL